MADSFFIPQNQMNLIPEADREAVANQARNNFLLGLFGTRKGFGAGLLAGNQLAQKSVLDYLETQDTARKAAAAAQERAARGVAASIINVDPTVSATAALGAEAGPTGPTNQRASLIGQPNPAAAVPIEQRLRMAATDPRVITAAPDFARTLASVADSAGPKLVNVNGQIVDMSDPRNRERFVPQLGEGMGPVGKDAQGKPVYGNLPGVVGAKGEMYNAQEAAKAAYDLVDVQGPDGTTYKVPRISLTGRGAPGQSGGGQPGAGGQGGGFGAVGSISPQAKTERENMGKFLVEQVLTPAKLSADAGAKTNVQLGTLARIIEATPLNRFTANETVQSIGGYFKAAGLLTDDAAKNVTNLATMKGLVSAAVLEKQLAQKGPQTEADAKRMEQTVQGMGDKDAMLFLVNIERAQNANAQDKYKFLLDYRRKNGGSLDGAEEAWLSRPDAGKSVFRRPELKRYAPVYEVNGKKYRVYGDGGAPEEVK